MGCKDKGFYRAESPGRAYTVLEMAQARISTYAPDGNLYCVVGSRLTPISVHPVTESLTLCAGDAWLFEKMVIPSMGMAQQIKELAAKPDTRV